MRNFKDIIIEKLKVTKNSLTFTWDDFIEALYKYDNSSFWLEDLPNIDGYDDLPEFKYEGKIVKAVSLYKFDSYILNETVNVIYSYNESSIRQDMTISSLDSLNDILDQELIAEIYEIISKQQK